MLNSGQNWQFFVVCDLEIWWMTLKNNRAPLLCCLKLCASFYSHHWIQTGVTVRKHPIWVKISDFCPVTLKFDRWPWKTIGHLFNTTLSFVHHFKAIGEFKLELQSGNAQQVPQSVYNTELERNKTRIVGIAFWSLRILNRNWRITDERAQENVSNWFKGEMLRSIHVLLYFKFKI